jgi:plasmid maintenance system killer protein
MMNTAPQARNTFNQLFTVYINKKIVSGDLNNLAGDFMEFVNSRPMTDSMRTKITQHFEQNKAGLIGAFSIWVAIYNLKMDVVNQLNKAAETAPVKGYLQDGTQTQEGFVSHGLKFVDRMGFSRQNLAGR